MDALDPPPTLNCAVIVLSDPCCVSICIISVYVTLAADGKYYHLADMSGTTVWNFPFVGRIV